MTAERKSGDGESTRVLLVEDHDDTRDMMVLALRNAGYTVVAASGYADAVAKARASAFDVLISDLQLGDGSGWKLLRHLWGRHSFVAIAVSGHACRSDMERSHAAGFCEHLTKPIRLKEMIDAITRCQQHQTHAA
jgi:CheY-like chemotaxis protein